MPSPQTAMSFTSLDRQLPLPFIVFADFECLLRPIATCAPDPNVSSTHLYQRHEPSGFAYLVLDHEGQIYSQKLYRGSDCVEQFFKHLLEEYEQIRYILSHPVAMVMTPADRRSFATALTCFICQEAFTPQHPSVRDHDHLTGRYRGAAHGRCNLLWKYKPTLSIFFHNLSSYDSHLLVRALSFFGDENVSVIPKTTERYTAIHVKRFIFKDSLQFLPASLDTLAKTLPVFPLMQRVFPDHHALLSRKGVFPYEYVTSFDVFEETQLPPKEAFYSSLTGEHISDADYAHALDVWERTGCQTVGEYQDQYLLCDVVLLSDIYQNFRRMGLEYYGIDPGHYYSLPGYAWDSALKMTGESLQLLSDVDMYLFFERGIRGGISLISHRFAEANNEYLPNYDPTQPTSYINFIDSNNLYGFALCKPLPHSNFRWLSDEEIENLDVAAFSETSETAFILEVDLLYPEHLHEMHSSYPLAPSTLTIQKEDLSPYNDRLHSEYHLPPKTTKLVGHFFPHNRYVCHSQNLQFYLKHGLQLVKIHRAISFTQRPWLAPFIRFNTARRQEATNAFAKDFFKLMCNSTFGKTCENLRRRVNIRLTTSAEKARKLLAKPSVAYFDLLAPNLTLFHLHKTSLTLDRPVYAGFAVLELSKLVMFRFHYEYMLPLYGDKCRLLMSDTDSLAYYLETADLYRDMERSLHHFDTSNYPPTHFLYSEERRCVPGIFKDETASVPISQFVGLKSKMYSMRYGDTIKKVGKGIKKAVLRRIVRHEHYLQCLRDHCRMSYSMNSIRSYRHQLFTISQKKIGLSSFDDKRYVLADGITTLPYGHFRTRAPPAPL